ncbi:hypothetical protein EVAR_45357_1 [Eumeta japonica]|uniref:Uncharacterized protein n=1 Tax=Eumeta variegata TaxID=151549 RepID=A0A4C1Y0I4_EUMVA|nr:hypothetical protein EVAR_45357_1 [Eumeta japonica]
MRPRRSLVDGFHREGRAAVVTAARVTGSQFGTAYVRSILPITAESNVAPITDASVQQERTQESIKSAFKYRLMAGLNGQTTQHEPTVQKASKQTAVKRIHVTSDSRAGLRAIEHRGALGRREIVSRARATPPASGSRKPPVHRNDESDLHIMQTVEGPEVDRRREVEIGRTVTQKKSVSTTGFRNSRLRKRFWARSVKVQRPMDIKNRPRIPIPDEDPYSLAGSNANGSGGSSGSSGYGHNGHNGHNGHGVVAATREQLMMQMGQKRGDKPPKLPPRENGYGPADIPKTKQIINKVNETGQRGALDVDLQEIELMKLQRERTQFMSFNLQRPIHRRLPTWAPYVGYEISVMASG